MKKGKKLIAMICMLLMTALFMIPGYSYAESVNVIFDASPIVREDPGTHFYAWVENPVKGATYSATVSNKDVAKLVNGFADPGSFAAFVFYAKKSGKVTVTIKQTLNKKTKTIARKTYTIKSRKFSDAQKKKEKKYQKVISKGGDANNKGVSLEVLKVTNLKSTSSKVSAKVKLQHKVTAEEAAMAKKGFSVCLNTGNYNYAIALTGKLKKGSQYVNVSTSKKDIWEAKKATKKGTVYYLKGMNTKKGTPYSLKVKF